MLFAATGLTCDVGFTTDDEVGCETMGSDGMGLDAISLDVFYMGWEVTVGDVMTWYGMIWDRT